MLVNSHDFSSYTSNSFWKNSNIINWIPFNSLHRARGVKVKIWNFAAVSLESPLNLNPFYSFLDKVTAAGSITTTSSGWPCKLSQRIFLRVLVQIVHLPYTHICTNCTLDLPLLLSKKIQAQIKCHLPNGTRPGPDFDLHRQWLPWAQRAVPMFQCCWCDRLFSIQQAVKSHISNLTKIHNIHWQVRSRSVGGRGPARARLGVRCLCGSEPDVLEGNLGKPAIFIKDSTI